MNRQDRHVPDRSRSFTSVVLRENIYTSRGWRLAIHPIWPSIARLTPRVVEVILGGTGSGVFARPNRADNVPEALPNAHMARKTETRFVYETTLARGKDAIQC